MVKPCVGLALKVTGTLKFIVIKIVLIVNDVYRKDISMTIQETKQAILNSWAEPEVRPELSHDLHSLVEATQQEYKLLSPIQINDIIVGLEWTLNKQNFDCDCEPHYEYDTNATTHSDDCALSMIDHIEATLDELRKVAA